MLRVRLRCPARPNRPSSKSKSRSRWINVGGQVKCDILRDEGVAYADRLRLSGVEVTFEEVAGALHGFAYLLGLKEALAAVQKGSQWLASKLSQLIGRTKIGRGGAWSWWRSGRLPNQISPCCGMFRAMPLKNKRFSLSSSAELRQDSPCSGKLWGMKWGME